MFDAKRSGSATYASRETLIGIFETLPGALFFIDTDEIVRYASAGTQDITGTSVEELLGLPLWRSASQLVSTALYQAVQQVKKTQEPIEVRYLSPGINTWLHVHLMPDSDGMTLFFQKEMGFTRQQDFSTCNEQMYRDLLESFADGVTIITPEGLVLDINQRPLTDARIKPKDAIGQALTDLPAWSYDPEVQQQMRSAIMRASKGEIVCFEARIHPRADLYLDLLMTITSHRDASQQIEYLICAGKDITERKRAEDERYRLIEAIPHFMWIMWPDGSFEHGNQRWCDYTGLPLEKLQKDGWVESLHPDERRHVLEIWHTAVRTGAPYEVEHRIRSGETGAYRWFLARGTPLRDSQGKILRWIGTCTDIDEQKRTEVALRQSQERAQALMDSNIIGIIVSNEEEIEEANDAFLRMTGYSREDVQQGRMNWARMTPPEYQSVTRQAHQQLVQQSYMVPYEKEYVCKDGSRLPVLVGGVLFQNCPFIHIAFVLDITASKELEQRKDDFISMASHELKTPITSLKLQTQLLSKQLARQGASSVAGALPRMESQIRQLERLVGELLDVSKIQAGRLEYVRESVEIGALLQEVVETMQQMSENHTIVVHGATPLVVVGDKDRLGQVFINLLSNAIKYSPGADTVEIELDRSAEAAIICVRDHGLGIPREQCDRIFERFYRVTGPNQKSISGLGMGLYIVAEIVKSHGGSITMDSAVGEGSTFTVTIPCEPPA